MIDNPCLIDGLIADFSQSRCYDDTLRGYTISGDSITSINGILKVGNQFRSFWAIFNNNYYGELVTMLPNGSLTGSSSAGSAMYEFIEPVGSGFRYNYLGSAENNTKNKHFNLEHIFLLAKIFKISPSKLIEQPEKNQRTVSKNSNKEI